MDKFQNSVTNLNNLWSFFEIHAVFVLNLCGENLCGEKMTNMRSVHTFFVTPTSDIAESFSPVFKLLIFNLLKVGHPCSVVDDPNARDNLMQVYGCQSGIHKFVSQKIDI